MLWCTLSTLHTTESLGCQCLAQMHPCAICRLPAPSEDSQIAQHNLQIAQIPRLCGTCAQCQPTTMSYKLLTMVKTEPMLNLMQSVLNGRESAMCTPDIRQGLCRTSRQDINEPLDLKRCLLGSRSLIIIPVERLMQR